MESDSARNPALAGPAACAGCVALSDGAANEDEAKNDGSADDSCSPLATPTEAGIHGSADVSAIRRLVGPSPSRPSGGPLQAGHEPAAVGIILDDVLPAAAPGHDRWWEFRLAWESVGQDGLGGVVRQLAGRAPVEQLRRPSAVSKQQGHSLAM